MYSTIDFQKKKLILNFWKCRFAKSIFFITLQKWLFKIELNLIDQKSLPILRLIENINICKNNHICEYV